MEDVVNFVIAAPKAFCEKNIASEIKRRKLSIQEVIVRRQSKVRNIFVVAPSPRIACMTMCHQSTVASLCSTVRARVKKPINVRRPIL